jgi:subtilisin family serine protease
MLRRLIAAMVVLASGCFTPAPLIAQRPSQYILSVREGVPGAADSAIAAVARVGGAARYNTPVTVVAVVLASKVRDSLWLATDTNRVLVTGPWRRWLEAAEFDGFVVAPRNSTPPLEGAGGALSATTWGVDAVGAPAAWAMGARGQGVKVASLDSGIDPNHSGYLVGGGYNAITNESGRNFQDDISQCNGHGTHVGGTIADRTGRGVAPGALLYGLKVFEVVNGQCLSYNSRQISALNYAVNNGIRCVNISIGGANNSIAYQDAITAAWRAGVVVAAANGNAGATPALMPGRADSLLGVASVGTSLTRSGFSNYGPTTDLAAPGESIESTMPGGGYGGKSGTSMATPHVVGVCAIAVSERPSLPADSVMEFMRATAIPIGSPTPNDFTGYGLVRADRVIAALRGGLAIAASTTDTIRPADPLVQSCKPVVALRGYTLATDAPWLRAWTAGDSICYAIDSALVPTGGGTITGTVRYLVAAPPPPAPTGPVITVDLATRYQTMSGWEATAQAGQAEAAFPTWQAEVLDSGVAIGINRLRVELHSGAENPVDAYARFRAGQITSAQWNAARYVWVNDNADPLNANAPGFSWAKLDEAMSSVVLPMRTRLLARGDSLYLSLNYVSFGNSTAHADPAEWAELLLAAFQHLQARFGFVPNAIEVILEPDNNAGTWYGTAIGRAIATAGPRLAAAGFRPEFIAPSVTNLGNTVPYLDAMVAVPGVLPYLKEVSYHRYQGYSVANLQGIASRAKALGLRTSMLEHIASGIDDLLEDVTVGNASAWQQYTLAYPTSDNGAQYLPIIGGRPVVGSMTRLLAPVFQAVKRGAVRVGSTSADFTTAAWVNPDGRAAVVVRARSVGSATLLGLPAGRYQITFAPESGSTTSTTTTITGAYPVNLPAAGLLVVRGIP